MGALGWNDADTEKLIALWDDGFSGGKIAARMKMSRSAVLGKLYRIGLMAKGEEIRRPTVSFRPIALTRPLPGTKSPPPAPAEIPPSRDLTLEAVSDKVCRFPYGTGPEYLFCGHQVRDGSVYCSGHHAVCRTPAPLAQTGKRK